MSAPAKDGRRDCREIEPGATLERALDFTARWRECGGEAIELDDFVESGECEPLSLARLPDWACKIGAVFAPTSGRALVWVAPSAGEDGPFQFVLSRPIAWKRGPALASYAGIARAADANGPFERRFRGLERVSGEIFVLTLPARGEAIIIIAEMKHSGGD